jgi:Flp pilus assembly protein TadG
MNTPSVSTFHAEDGCSSGRMPPRVPVASAGEDKPCQGRRTRRGAAAVEFALVLPVCFLLLIGMIEFGRMLMVQQILTNASREGARKAVLDGSTASDVNSTVISYLGGASITITTSNITINPTNPATANGGDPITVTISVPFSTVSWLPASMLTSFLPAGQTDITLTSSAVMRREMVQQ